MICIEKHVYFTFLLEEIPVYKRGVVNFSQLQKAVTLLRAVGIDC